MIGLNMDETNMRMRCFCFGERAQGKAVERTMIADKELCYAVFGDVALDGAKQDRVEIRRGIGVTEEEAGFLFHIYISSSSF